MPTPSVYAATAEELEAVKARAFLFLMSSEVPSIDGPLGSALFDMVGDMSEKEAHDSIRAFEAVHD